MNSKRTLLYGLLSGLAMAVMILDTKTAISGAQIGVELCIRTVVPSLFPFIILSILLTNSLTGQRIPVLRPLGKLCRIPDGGESLLLAGLLGGYPVGAQCVAQAYRTGSISKNDARRMLGFCSNAGPAFIFGMAGGLFTSAAAAWALWGIHILSALLTGMLLPGGADRQAYSAECKQTGISAALQQSLRVMAGICGWVVVFRIIIGFCHRWFLWLLPEAASIMISGILELTNGCCMLSDLNSQPLRFVLCAVMLGFGGVCVAMQTVTVTQDVGTGLYFPGKLLQCLISFIFAILVQPLIFPEEQWITASPVLLACAVSVAGALLFLLRGMKNNSSNLAPQGV